jgi:hypothetical protein
VLRKPSLSKEVGALPHIHQSLFILIQLLGLTEERSERRRKMGRAPCCDKANMKKGPWSPEEDAKLKEYLEKQGTGGNWIALPQKAGKQAFKHFCLFLLVASGF